MVESSAFWRGGRRRRVLGVHSNWDKGNGENTDSGCTKERTVYDRHIYLSMALILVQVN